MRTSSAGGWPKELLFTLGMCIRTLPEHRRFAPALGKRSFSHSKCEKGCPKPAPLTQSAQSRFWLSSNGLSSQDLSPFPCLSRASKVSLRKGSRGLFFSRTGFGQLLSEFSAIPRVILYAAPANLRFPEDKQEVSGPSWHLLGPYVGKKNAFLSCTRDLYQETRTIIPEHAYGRIPGETR